MSKIRIGLFWHLSWLAVSSLYLAGRPQISLKFQIGVIILIYIIGRYMSKVYIQLVNVRIQNKKLEGIYTGFEQDMKHVFALYQYVNSLPVSEQHDGIYQMICQRVIKMTEAEMAFVWLAPGKTLTGQMVVMPELSEPITEEIFKFLEKTWEELEHSSKRLSIGGQWYLVIPMMTISKEYGVIGMKCDTEARKEVIDRQIRQIGILAKWSSAIIERACSDKMSFDWMIKEEQKRIANEIHDGVAQRLFGVTSAAYALKTNSKSSEMKIKEQLELISDSANKAMQELRLIIYGLNRRQETQINFFENIKEYLKDTANLNQVNINVKFCGDENKLKLANKRSIFRIIKEATGNAIRHGKSTQISVLLEIDDESLNLTIKDDGQGFDYYTLDDRRLGLGLKNMESLISTLQGDFEMESSKGKGTSIQVRIPLNRVREIRKEEPFLGGVAS